MSKELIDELVIALEWALGKMESDTAYIDPHRRSISQIEADGMLPAQIYRARSAITKAKRGERATELPEEYNSLVYLHRYVGCVKIVEFACKIWNELHQLDSLRLKCVKEPESTIIVTGKCQDLGFFLSICRYLTGFGVHVQHEKTIMRVELEV